MSSEIVGSQFCSSTQTLLTVRKKPLLFCGGGCSVTDCNGKVVFKLDGNTKANGILLDGQGKPLLTLRRHRKILCPYERWEGFLGGKMEGQKPIFRVKRWSIFNSNTFVDVFMESNRGEKDFDYRIDYKERSCTVYTATKTIAAEGKPTTEEALAKDVFIVAVRPGFDQAFIMALITVLNQMAGEDI